MSDSNGRRFLDHFPARHRGAINNWFCNAVRSGIDNPEEVCCWVCNYLRQSVIQGGGSIDRSEVVHWINEDWGAACELAASVIATESLSQDERQKQKAEAAEAGRREWMAQQPPTEKQVEILRKLGHICPIESRLEASEMIEYLKDW